MRALAALCFLVWVTACSCPGQNVFSNSAITSDFDLGFDEQNIVGKPRAVAVQTLAKMGFTYDASYKVETRIEKDGPVTTTTYFRQKGFWCTCIQRVFLSVAASSGNVETINKGEACLAGF